MNISDLRGKIINEFDGMIQDLVEQIKSAENEGEGLDITVLFGKQSGRYKEIIKLFDEFSFSSQKGSKGWGK